MFKAGLKRVSQMDNKVRRWTGNLNVRKNKPIQEIEKCVYHLGVLNSFLKKT